MTSLRKACQLYGGGPVGVCTCRRGPNAARATSPRPFGEGWPAMHQSSAGLCCQCLCSSRAGR
eukprot:5823014-Alexandrium_andersonii.AAC.1